MRVQGNRTADVARRQLSGIFVQSLASEIIGLASLQDGLEDVGSKERTREHFTDISFCKCGVSCERSLIECVAFEYALVPAMSSRQGF